MYYILWALIMLITEPDGFTFIKSEYYNSRLELFSVKSWFSLHYPLNNDHDNIQYIICRSKLKKNTRWKYLLYEKSFLIDV